MTPMETSGFFFAHVNYLAHHFLYANEDSLFNVGLILPDLSRRASGRRKVSLLQQSDNREWLSLQAGCECHYEADAWFHECDYFSQVSTKIDAWITDQKRTGLFLMQRSWFLGHILAEMLLDRLIIDAYPHSLDHFYRDLNAVELATLCGFLKAAGKQDTTAFEHMYRGFSESEFIRHYRYNEGLVESLSRLVQRTKQNGFSDSEKDVMIQQLPHWIELAHKTKKPHQMARLLWNP